MSCNGIDSYTLIIAGVAIGFIAATIVLTWAHYGLYKDRPWPYRLRFGKKKQKTPEVTILGIR